MRDKNSDRANLGEQNRRSGSESDQVSRPNLDRDRAAGREESQKDVGAKRPIEHKDEDTLRRATPSPRREGGTGGGDKTGGSTSGRPDEKVAGKGFTMDRSKEKQQTSARPERDESLSKSPRREQPDTPRREQSDTPRREQSDTPRREQPDITRRQTTTPKREESSSDTSQSNRERDRDIDRSKM